MDVVTAQVTSALTTMQTHMTSLDTGLTAEKTNLDTMKSDCISTPPNGDSAFCNTLLASTDTPFSSIPDVTAMTVSYMY